MPLTHTARRPGGFTTRIGAALAVALSFAAPLQADDPGASNGIAGPTDVVLRQGLWWSPDHGGSGWDLNRIGDFLFVVWYTYAEDGSPVWYTAGADMDGNRFQGDLMRHRWDHAAGAVEGFEVVGSLDIAFPHPQIAEVQWELGEAEGSRVLQPFRFASTPTLDDHSGIYHDPAETGYGVSVQTQGEHVYAVIYHYDAAGEPTWRSGAGREGERSFDLTRTTGSCPSCAQVGSDHQPAGELSLQFETETRMRIALQTSDGSWDRPDAGQLMLSDPPSGRPHPAAMAKLASADALKYFFDRAYRASPTYDMPIICAPAPILSPAPPTDAGNGELVSGTNVQEAGVDEADLVKATTDLLFSIDAADFGTRFESAEDGEGDEGHYLQSITRWQVSPGAGNPSFEARYEVTYPEVQRPQHTLEGEGLFLHAGAEDTNRMLYLGSQVESSCWGTGLSRSIVQAWEYGEGTDETVDVSLVIDGRITSSRLIGDRLFLLTSYQPDFHAIAARFLPSEEQKEAYTQEEFRAILAALDGEMLLPRVRLGDGSEHTLVTADRVMIPPLPGHRLSAELNVLSVFDVNDLGAPPVSAAILGRADGLYATPEGVWVAGARQHVEITPEGRVTLGPYVDTDLHRFSISDKGVEYAGSGTIEGGIGHDPRRLAFRLSEHEGALRVLSDSGWWQERWGDAGSNRLTVLGTEAGGDFLLPVRAVLPNDQRPERIGKPEESVHAVRFFGDRGYVVTFRRIDPLYALDLSNPNDPFVLGALEIPGYSEYLHPVGADLLLGVGMDAINVNEGTPQEFTVEQGVLVGLFDVSDPGAPVLLDEDTIGDSGSSTPVLQSHHNFTWLPGDATIGRPHRFSLPVDVHGPRDGVYSPDPSWSYPWLATGALMYEIVGERGAVRLDRLGRADLADWTSVPRENAVYYDSYSMDRTTRGVIHNDRLFVIHWGGLFTTSWGSELLVPADGCDRCTWQEIERR